MLDVRRILCDQSGAQGGRNIRSAGFVKLTRHQNAILLGLIIVLGLALRLWHYTGPIGSDDSHYYLAARLPV